MLRLRSAQVRRLPILLAALLLASPAWASWTFQQAVSNNNKVSSSMVAGLSDSLTYEAGNIVIVGCAADNISTSSGDTSDHSSVSDSQSNTYTKIREHTKSAGAAADGTTVSLWVSDLTNSVVNSASIQCNFSTFVTAKALVIVEYAIASGKTYSIAGSATADGSGTTPSATIGSLASAEYLFVGLVGLEGPNGDTFTQATNYSNLSDNGTTGGSAVTNTSERGGYRILTATGDTYAPTLGTSRDWAEAYAALQEVNEGAPPPVQAPLRRQVITQHSAPTPAAGR